MNDNEINAHINNLINLRTTYYSMMFILSGALVNLCRQPDLFDTVILIIGILIDFFFILVLKDITKKLNILLKQLKDK